MFSYIKHCQSARLSNSKTTIDLVLAILKKPLQKRNLQTIARKFSLSENQAAQVAGMSLTKYRGLKATAFLSIQVTDRVVKLSELYHVGMMTFDGDKKSLLGWLRASIPALNYNRPIELLNTFVGIDYVKELLLRMEYSIPD